MQTGLNEKGRCADTQPTPQKKKPDNKSESHEEAQRQAKNRGRKCDDRRMPRLPHKLRLHQYLYDNVSIPIKLGFRASQLSPDESQYFYAVVQRAESAHGIKYGVMVELDWIERKTGLSKSRQIKAHHSLIKKGLLADMGHDRIHKRKESFYVGVCLHPRGDV